ncbi:universal stress protein [Streptomyces sp. JJ66]|uniref:universal stress protein n=1 Tax=Streptomyces sp. JJ66 TaxID=2803843 RepID=UPI001C59442A|nr:universal stress protein [Streptomyces sp. JJ66]MBW1603709.1 universal stress protein [Streptomyces sp. JJ66]
MVRQIVAGVDGSPESTAAAAWAAREAVSENVPLRLVHASRGPVGGTKRHLAKEMLVHVQTQLLETHPSLDITTRMAEGSATDALLEEAREAALLVLGSRGIGTLVGFLTGSVSLRTIGKAPCPVVLVRSGHADHEAQEPDPSGAPSAVTRGRPVVLALDLPAPGEELAEFAFQFAARHGAKLSIVHASPSAPVYPYASGIPSMMMEIEDLEREEREEAARLLNEALEPLRARYPGVEAAVTAQTGTAGHLLVEAAREAGLLVVGRKIRDSVVGPHTGHVAHAVLHHAPSPVAVVPHH